MDGSSAPTTNTSQFELDSGGVVIREYSPEVQVNALAGGGGGGGGGGSEEAEIDILDDSSNGDDQGVTDTSAKSPLNANNITHSQKQISASTAAVPANRANLPHPSISSSLLVEEDNDNNNDDDIQIDDDDDDDDNNDDDDEVEDEGSDEEDREDSSLLVDTNSIVIPPTTSTSTSESVTPSSSLSTAPPGIPSQPLESSSFIASNIPKIESSSLLPPPPQPPASNPSNLSYAGIPVPSNFQINTSTIQDFEIFTNPEYFPDDVHRTRFQIHSRSFNKTPQRYKKIRDFIVAAWEKCKPAYLTKTTCRKGELRKRERRSCSLSLSPCRSRGTWRCPRNLKNPRFSRNYWCD